MRPYVPHATELALHVANTATWMNVFEPRISKPKRRQVCEYQPQIEVDKLDKLIEFGQENLPPVRGFQNVMPKVVS